MGDGTWYRREERRRGAQRGRTGGGENRATTRWDWGTSRHGVLNHGPTMGSLATGRQENALKFRTAVRCPQG